MTSFPCSPHMASAPKQSPYQSGCNNSRKAAAQVKWRGIPVSNYWDFRRRNSRLIYTVQAIVQKPTISHNTNKSWAQRRRGGRVGSYNMIWETDLLMAYCLDCFYRDRLKSGKERSRSNFWNICCYADGFLDQQAAFRVFDDYRLLDSYPILQLS